MLTFFYLLIATSGALFLFNWLMGYRGGTITLDLDNRYVDTKEYMKAVQEELEQQGKDVEYIGYREFLIDGIPYLVIERNVAMGGIPLQHTILKKKK